MTKSRHYVHTHCYPKNIPVLRKRVSGLLGKEFPLDSEWRERQRALRREEQRQG